VRGYADVGVDQVILLLLAFDEAGLIETLDALSRTIVEPLSAG